MAEYRREIGISGFAGKGEKTMETSIDFDPLLRGAGRRCSCGKLHRTDMRFLRVGEGALIELPELIGRLGAKRVMLLAGPQTDRAAGEKLQPNEAAVDRAVREADPRCDLMLAVGSGSVNDVCKAAATRLGLPQLTVGTAPSMDGYTSASSSLEVNNTKASLPERAPVGLLCDLDVMAAAPMRLLWAGLGDMIAKRSSLIEWRIAALVNGEPYCPEVAAMVRRAYEKAMAGAPGLGRRDRQAVQNVIEGLLLSGIGMSYMDSSRPASGQEHYFSHCWEMMAIARGRDYDLHGVYVGVGTPIALRILERMAALTPSMERVEQAIARFDNRAWEQRLERVFPGTGSALAALEKSTRNNDPEQRRCRAARLIEHWEEIRRIIRDDLPDITAMEESMRWVGMPVRPADIGLDAREVADAFVCSRDIRDKYLTSSMLFDLGYLEEFEAWILEEY